MKNLFRNLIYVVIVLEAAGQNVSPDIIDKDQDDIVTQQKIKNYKENNDQCQVLSEGMKEMREFKDKTTEQLNNMEQSLQDLISRVLNPCTVDPCGPNSESNNLASCSCLHGGSPPHCIVNGNWAAWGTWGRCQSNCKKTRTRSCSDPAPENGGAGCSGPGTEDTGCHGGSCEDAQCLAPYSTIRDGWRKAVYTPAGVEPCHLYCDDDLMTGWYRFEEPAGVSLPIKPPGNDNYFASCEICQTRGSAWIKERRQPAQAEGVIPITFCWAVGGHTCWGETPGQAVQCDGFYLYHLTSYNYCDYAFCVLG